MAIVTCTALSLTACSGAGTPAPASSPGSGSAAASAPTSSAGGATIVSATALCEYLRERLPTLRKIGSEVGAMGNLAGNLYSWYEKQGAVPIGSEMDEQTQQACPDVRTEVLKLAGTQSFASL
jgi:hypothetical protein